MRLLQVMAAAAVSLLLCGPAAAQTSSHAVDIKPEPMRAALRDLGAQTGLQILFRADDVSRNGKMTPAVSGNLTAQQALERLLANTGLKYEFVNEHTVRVSTSQTKTVSATDAADPSGDPGGNGSAQTNLGSPQVTSTVGNSVENSANDQPGGPALTEIIVTAQKREERLIDVPISIVAVSGDELQKRGIVSLEDLPSVVPDLAISNTGNNHYIEMRGISNGNGNSSLIGMYIDEADVTLGGAAVTQLNPTVYDLERVEVLRGPQGTLYGEGSAGGTIRFITKNPDLNQFSIDSDVSALYTQDGAPSEHINAVVNVPLIDNELGLRVAGTFDHDGGWINQSAADQTNINWQNLTNVRFKALWKVNPDFTLSAMAIVNRNDRSLDISDPNNPGNWTQVFNLTTTPRVGSNYDLYNLTLTYEFAVARLLNTTSYIGVAAPWTNQGFSYPFSPPPEPRWDFYAPYQQTNDHVLTDELRLNSLASGPWQWTLGAFARRYTDFYDIPDNYFGQAGPPGTPPPAPYPLVMNTVSKSWSAFGDTSYIFADRLTVGAGLRYFQDDQAFDSDQAPGTQTKTFHSVDPRFYAQYKLVDDVNLYTSASRGFRSGGFNLGSDLPTYDPESVWTYELGEKMILFQGHLTFDTALFLSDYSDYQIYGNFGAGEAIPIFSNAGTARIKGAEWDLTYRPADHWSLGLNGDYVDTRFTEINATATAYDVGDQLDLIPKYQFTASLQRDFQVSGKAAFARLDYSQTGRETSRNRSDGSWYFGESNVIDMLNFHTSVNLTKAMRFGVFAQNLLNDQGFTNPFAYTLGGGVRPRPRTVGVEFGVSVD